MFNFFDHTQVKAIVAISQDIQVIIQFQNFGCFTLSQILKFAISFSANFLTNLAATFSQLKLFIVISWK